MPTSRADSASRRPPFLVVERLSAGYGGGLIIGAVSVQVGLGEIVSIIGPNGAGKSTLLKAIAGFIPAAQGRVLLAGEEVTNLPSNQLARKGLGYVPQVNDVFETLTVRENLEMGGYILPDSEVTGRLEEVMAIFPALDKMTARVASKLSGGERKMVAIARALMARPRVLILDEPTSNLSPDLSRDVLRDQVRRLASAGVAVLLVEQKARAALEISDWAYILAGGMTKLAASAGDLLARKDIAEVFLGQAVEGVTTDGSEPGAALDE